MISPDSVLVGRYDSGRVILSVLLAMMGAFCAIELGARVSDARGRTRIGWMIGGALAMGIGTWSMHYVGMFAFVLPIPVRYDWPTALLSFLGSVFASAVALFVVSRPKMDFRRTVGGSIFMGGGISVQHYIAMASMRMDGLNLYSPPIVVLSIALAILLSFLSLRQMFAWRELPASYTSRKLLGAFLLGAAIPSMHYTAMIAVTFVRSAEFCDSSHAVAISDLGILGIVAANVEVVVVMALTSITDQVQRQKALLERSNEQLHILSRRIFQVQEEEKRHLARELHDVMGQALTAAQISLQSARNAEDAAEVRRQLGDGISILDQLLQQTRDLSLDLRSPLLDDFGLVPALRWYLDHQAGRANLRVEFFAHPGLERLGVEIETACFRVAQEAVTNIVRHARAKTVAVKLDRTADALHLIVRDDGIGFDVASALERVDRGGTFGLIGMRERVALVGGELDIKSGSGGTEVHAFLPLPAVGGNPGAGS